jgi:hypothetical protein
MYSRVNYKIMNRKGELLMKKRLSALFASIFVISSLTFPPNVYAASENHLTKQLDVMDEETMYTDVISVKGLISADNYVKGVKYAFPASELVIELKDDLPANSSVKLTLQNGVWFFRSVNLNGDQYANEYYTGGIEEKLPTNYNTTVGEFIPTSSTSTSGVYTRIVTAANEIPYILHIGSDDSVATLVTSRDGKEGESIRVPLVTRALQYEDMYVTIESYNEISSSTHKFAEAVPYSGISEAAKKIKKSITEVKTPVEGKTVFPIDKITISEKVVGTISEGTFEITAPQGVKILPDVPSDLIKENDYKALNMTVNGESAVKLHLSENIKWTKDTKRSGYGINDKDYTLTYHYPAGEVNYSRVFVELKGIEKSRRDEISTLTITGLKLVADDTVPKGNINLQIKNYMKTNLEPQSFTAAVKTDTEYYEKVPTAPANLENYSINDLIELDEFKLKPYITAENGLVQPQREVSRAELCQMLFELFADKDKFYVGNFYDVSAQYANAVSFCGSKGFVSGYTDGTFRPNKSVTRGEISIILNNILKLNEDVELSLLEKDHWAYEAMAQLVNIGAISGYPDNTLRPDATVTKAEAVSIISRAFGRGTTHRDGPYTYTDIPSDHWAYSYLMNALHPAK